jgi:hypothetical protein
MLGAMMMKKLLLAAAIATNAIPAQAFEIGASIIFNVPDPIYAACTQMRDARIVTTRKYGFEKIDFVHWVNSDDDFGRHCVVLNEKAKNSWRIVKKNVADRGYAWFCVQATGGVDFRPATEIKAEREYKERLKELLAKNHSAAEIERIISNVPPTAWGGSDAPCYWAYLRDR